MTAHLRESGTWPAPAPGRHVHHERARLVDTVDEPASVLFCRATRQSLPRLFTTASPKPWMDACLAAFALLAGYRLVTTDRAYRQFDALDVLLLLGEG